MTNFFFPAFILEPEANIQIEDSLGNVFNQTLTYSGDAFDEKSLKLNVPPHRGKQFLLTVLQLLCTPPPSATGIIPASRCHYHKEYIGFSLS